MNSKLLLQIYKKKHGLVNIYNLLKHTGKLTLPNGYILRFNKGDNKFVKSFFEFCIFNGIKLLDKPGHWSYKDGIISIPNGIKFLVNNFDSCIIAETFLTDIHFSAFDLTGKIVVQAGGFIGDTALYYANRGAKIYSFEPDINSFNLGVENIKLNPDISQNIVFENAAIGEDGDVLFPNNPNGSGGSSLYTAGNHDKLRIKSISLSTIFSKYNIISPFLLDLDIKGKEFDVINDENISKFEMVRIEYSTKIDGMKIGNRDSIIKKLSEYGFKKIRIFKHNDEPFDLLDHGTIEAVK